MINRYRAYVKAAMGDILYNCKTREEQEHILFKLIEIIIIDYQMNKEKENDK